MFHFLWIPLHTTFFYLLYYLKDSQFLYNSLSPPLHNKWAGSSKA